MESVLNVSYIMLGLIWKLSAFWCGFWGQNPLPREFYLVKVGYIVYNAMVEFLKKQFSVSHHFWKHYGFIAEKEHPKKPGGIIGTNPLRGKNCRGINTMFFFQRQFS